MTSGLCFQIDAACCLPPSHDVELRRSPSARSSHPSACSVGPSTGSSQLGHSVQAQLAPNGLWFQIHAACRLPPCLNESSAVSTRGIALDRDPLDPWCSLPLWPGQHRERTSGGRPTHRSIELMIIACLWPRKYINNNETKKYLTYD